MAALTLAVALAITTLAACIPADLKQQKNAIAKTKIAIQPVFTNKADLLYEELVYIYSKQHDTDNIARPKTLTPCAKAILGCCKEGQMQEQCSVDVGCGAHFFDDNPCDESFVKEALSAARTFYGQFGGKYEIGS